MGAIIVYDVTKKKSFENVRKWVKILKENTDLDIVIYIVGNKLDIVQKFP